MDNRPGSQKSVSVIGRKKTNQAGERKRDRDRAAKEIRDEK